MGVPGCCPSDRTTICISLSKYRTDPAKLDKKYRYIECLNIHGTHMTSNKSTNNNVVSDLKIVYYNYY